MAIGQLRSAKSWSTHPDRDAPNIVREWIARAEATNELRKRMGFAPITADHPNVAGCDEKLLSSISRGQQRTYASSTRGKKVKPAAFPGFMADNPSGPSNGTKWHAFNDCPSISGIASPMDRKTAEFVGIGKPDICKLCEKRIKR
jgi:hypothetical protein